MIWVNGKRFEAGDLAISPADRGFTRGDGIFETMRAYSGKLFRLEDHLARLAGGAAKMQISVPSDLRGQVDNAVKAATDAGHFDFAFRLILTRGIAQGVGLMPGIGPTPSTVAVTINQIPDNPKRGLRVKIAEGRKNLHSVLTGVKTLSYAESTVEILRAQDRSGDGGVSEGVVDDVIYFDTDRNLSEATTSNIFIVKNSEMITPSVDCAILPGITRKVVMEIAVDMGIPVTERKVSREELMGADEIFLTSSVREVASVVQIGEKKLGYERVGVVTERVVGRFREIVGT